jgi:hypothetical protein
MKRRRTIERNPTNCEANPRICALLSGDSMDGDT